MAEDDRLFAEAGGNGQTPVGRVLAHIETTRRHDAAAHTRAASLLTALLQTPEHLVEARRWYEARLKGLECDTEEGRQATLAFLAAEGAFFLRFFGLLSIDHKQWERIFADIGKLVPAQPGNP